MAELREPTCGDCLAFNADRFDEEERILGTCRLRPELNLISETLPWCDSFAIKPSRKGKVLEPKRTKAAGAPGTRGGSRRDRPERKVVRHTLARPVTGDTQGEITVDRDGLKQVLRELLEEETLYGYPEMAPRFHDGEVLIKPADDSLQPKSVPLDALFHKIVMVRDRLRVLEAKINGHKGLAEADKVELQSYISKCYGSLTTFNVLFDDRADWFKS